MANLLKYILTSLWAYFTPNGKVSENTYITNSVRKLYVSGPAGKATDKITPPNELGLPLGTLLTCDDEEFNKDLNYHRIVCWKGLVTLVPAWVTAYFKEHFPGEPEAWQLWIDGSGVNEWSDAPPAPDPIPDPIPDPLPVVGKKYRIVAVVELTEIEEILG